MSIATYDKFKSYIEVYNKLKQAAIEAKATDKRYDFDQVAEETRKHLSEKL